MVSRFIQAKQYAREPIPSDFFMPRERGEEPEPERLELSAFEIDGLSEHAAWDLGWTHRVQVGRRLYARADFHVSAAGELLCDEDEPPERHRVFHGWPAQEQLQRLFAHDLADAATYHAHPGGRTGLKAAAQPYPGVEPV